MSVRLTDEAGIEHTVEIRNDGTVVVGGDVVTVRQTGDRAFQVEAGSRNTIAWAIAAGDARWAFIDGRAFRFTVARGIRRSHRAAGYHESLAAPMPATVVKVNVKAGDAIRKGDVLVVLEAMKMELPVRAASEGRVASVNCREGELVQAGVTLIEIEE